MARELAAFDPSTGEIFGVVARAKLGRHPYAGMAWYIASEADYEHALRHLRGEECRVFAFLPLIMQQCNWLHASATLVAKRAQIHRVTASRILAKLEREQIIGEVHGAKQFNPRIAWKGPFAIHARAVLDWDEALRTRIGRKNAATQC